MFFQYNMVLVPCNSNVEYVETKNFMKTPWLTSRIGGGFGNDFWGGPKLWPTSVQTLGRQLTHESIKVVS